MSILESDNFSGLPEVVAHPAAPRLLVNIGLTLNIFITMTGILVFSTRTKESYPIEKRSYAIFLFNLLLLVPLLSV